VGVAGGLGKKLMAEWKVWMCAADVPCSAREGVLVHFTFSERHQGLATWGHRCVGCVGNCPDRCVRVHVWVQRSAATATLPEQA